MTQQSTASPFPGTRTWGKAGDRRHSLTSGDCRSCSVTDQGSTCHHEPSCPLSAAHVRRGPPRDPHSSGAAPQEQGWGGYFPCSCGHFCTRSKVTRLVGIRATSEPGTADPKATCPCQGTLPPAHPALPSLLGTLENGTSSPS